MSRKTLQDELKIIESSFKKTTTSGCSYEVSEKTAKKFIRLKQGTDMASRIILQSMMDTFQENFFDSRPSFTYFDIINKTFKPSDNSRELFNYFIFKIASKKKPIHELFSEKYEKLLKKIDKLNKKFQEIAFREEFFFEKLTSQIVERYRKTMKPYEFLVLKMIFDFQNNLRLFNWNVVDKDVQVEFLYSIFTLLQVKQHLLDIDGFDIINIPSKEGIDSGVFESSEDNIKPRLMEILYIMNSIDTIKRRISKVEATIFTQGIQDIIQKIGNKKNNLGEEKIITRYLELLFQLNKMINRFKQFRKENSDSKIVEKLTRITREKIQPRKIEDKEQLDDIYKNEFYLVGFIIRQFKKIFLMLRKKRTMSDGYVIKRLVSEIAKRDRLRVIALFVVVSLNAAVGMIMPLVLGDLTTYLDEGAGDINTIYFYGWIFIGISVFGLFFSICANWFVQLLGNKVMFDMREKMFENLQHLSFDYYNAQPSGKIISYITNDVETIQELISSGFLTIVIDVVRLVAAIFLMFYKSWQLSLTSFAIIPFILLLGFVIFSKARRYFVIMRRKIAAVTTHLQESIAGMRVIKSFAIEEKDATTFKRAAEEELEINLKAAKLFSSLPGLITMVISLGIGVLIMVGGRLHVNWLVYGVSKFAVGDLLAFLMYLFQFFGPIIAMMQFITNIQNSMAAGERIIRLIDADATVKEKENAISVEDEKYEKLSHDNVVIRFENVNFEYEKDQPILKNISVVTQPGERLALVGYTGAGKTTFIKLLARFWDVTTGRILINNIDIRNFEFDALREMMGVVLQDNFLFSGTVMDNIKYGKRDASDEEVFDITRKLGIHEFILNMEDGYDTPVLERGSRLSAGQRQMIAFARALLIDPPILILDEATSSIDPYSEIIVKNALDELLKDRTSITIAHRLSTVLNSDRIFVMDSGRIVEEGSHEELVQKEDGLYNHLYSMQFTKISNNGKK
ncbi:ATP-binding cassette domain-containing protein [Candidatus Bathyarchaeota archaeon]|nr:ATP-binding cassette domain-containing protein [Candidatus Bathyarchaeota archaeon]